MFLRRPSAPSVCFVFSLCKSNTKHRPLLCNGGKSSSRSSRSSVLGTNWETGTETYCSPPTHLSAAHTRPRSLQLRGLQRELGRGEGCSNDADKDPITQGGRYGVHGQLVSAVGSQERVILRLLWGLSIFIMFILTTGKAVTEKKKKEG
jgi:hypothetical protein